MNHIATLPLPYPFELGFMQRALLASVIVGIFAPMIGTFLVQKRLSLIGDGIGHIAFAGVGAGLLLGVWPVWAALVFAVIGAVGIERLRSRRAASGDLALALFFYSGIALGVVLASRGGGLNASLLTYLFGQTITVQMGDIVLIGAVAVVIVATMSLFRPVLFSIVTDEDWSRVAGLPVQSMNTLLAVLTAFGVVASMRVVGILLVAAMMVLPVASAQALAKSFRGTLGWAVVIGVTSSVIGIAASRVWGLASGGTIVLVAAFFFAMVSVISRAAPRMLKQEAH